MAERRRPQAPPAVQLESLRRFRRRRWWLAVPWIATAVVGIGMAVFTPSVYESSVLLSLRRLAPAGAAPAPSPGFEADMLREQTRATPFLRSVLDATGID